MNDLLPNKALISPQRLQRLFLPALCGEALMNKGQERITALAVAALLALGLLWQSACTQQLSTDGSSDKPSDSIIRKHEEYIRKIQTELNQIDQQIEWLQREANKDGLKARARTRQAIIELNEKSAAAHEKLEHLKRSYSNQEAWNDIKAGVNAAMDDLKAAYQRTASNLK
jgi:hypothetical protein